MIDLAAIPHSPGCYLYSDAAGTIIYDGKAKDLRKRVTSYFQKKDHDVKTRNLVVLIASVDLMVTDTETEALLLENNLIKKHQPKYNIDLKDAKRYAYIEITKEPFPRIGIERQTRREDATYFGPFVSAAERDAILRVIKRIFLLRSCRKLPKRACLRYHMGSCSGPCIGAVSEEAYQVQVERASALLRGKGAELLKSLQDEMAECSRTPTARRWGRSTSTSGGTSGSTGRPLPSRRPESGYILPGGGSYCRFLRARRGGPPPPGSSSGPPGPGTRVALLPEVVGMTRRSIGGIGVFYENERGLSESDCRVGGSVRDGVPVAQNEQHVEQHRARDGRGGRTRGACRSRLHHEPA